MVPTDTVSSLHPRATHLDATSTLVSQEADCGGADASSESEEEEYSV
jgi:hypothetical protein